MAHKQTYNNGKVNTPFVFLPGCVIQLCQPCMLACAHLYTEVYTVECLLLGGMSIFLLMMLVPYEATTTILSYGVLRSKILIWMLVVDEGEARQTCDIERLSMGIRLHF